MLLLNTINAPVTNAADLEYVCNVTAEQVCTNVMVDMSFVPQGPDTQCYGLHTYSEKFPRYAYLLDGIHVRIMIMFSIRHQKYVEWKTKFCPEYQNDSSSRMNEGKCSPVVKMFDFVFEVTNVHRYRVDLEMWKCSCNGWQVDGFPCVHAIICILGGEQDVYSFCECYLYPSKVP